MSIGIAEEHQALAETVSSFLNKNDAIGASRALLEAGSDALPPFWGEIATMGWLGLHLPEEVGGSDFGFPELAVLVEQFGRAVVPGPLVPTLVVSATLAAAGSESLKQKYLAGLADGSVVGAVGLTAELTAGSGGWSGSAPAVVSAGVSDVILLPDGDDVVLFETSAPGLERSTPPNMDPSRRSARVRLSGTAGERITGARRLFVDLARVLFAAEATGVAAECTNVASAYAKVRHQFGRPIGVFQAVKHHCANMALATELATAATWDAARAVAGGGDQLSIAAAIAAAVAVPAAATNAEMNIQVHGGIGYTWEDNAHLYFRRALAISALVSEADAAQDVTDITRRGVRRTRALELPPEADAIRGQVRDFAERAKGLDEGARRTAMLDEGYAMPHWPKPWGRSAQAVEQLVIEEEFTKAGITRPVYPPITAYVTLTLIQQGSEEQISRWVEPMLHGELEWCQLFSEPDAGSDAASIKTRGVKVEGGWMVNGQKVWTSSAHEANFGLATVRTDPDAPKHAGVTMMVVDMHDPGVEIRPLRQLTGSSGFNEVFLTDVFVPDDNVVGEVGGGWTVARATLGNESISVGAGTSVGLPTQELIDALDAHPDRLPGGGVRVGRCIAAAQANELVNLRSIYRAVSGSGPGPEAAITKLAFTESMLDGAHALATLAGPDLAYLENLDSNTSTHILGARVWAIGGGTSEIKRNQIGERILGLPRDPLLS